MSNSWDIPVKRQEKIMEMLHATGHIRVNELGELFKVADITIRRDLDTLEARGMLERVHGGAVPLSRLRHEKAFSQKYQHNLEIKKQLAMLLPRLVEDGDLVCINSGSTMLIGMETLIYENITIFTNNGGIFQSLPQYSTWAPLSGQADQSIPSALPYNRASLNILGGYIRPESLAIVGPGAISQLANIYPTKTFLGVDGFNTKSGLTSPNELEAEVSRKMIAQTRGDVILVADHSKIGVVSSFAISGIDKVSTIVCDDALDPSYRQSITDAGIRLLLSPAAPTP